MKKIIFLLLLFFFVDSAQGQITESNYRIYSVKLGKEVLLRDVAQDMANYDVLFFGEEHNDSVTHFLEKSMLELLYSEYGSNVALSMEMFDRDVQLVMYEYLNGFIQERHFKKDARVWSNYRDYRPMVEFAKEKGFDVICANAPTRYVNLAGRRGEQALDSLPEESKDFLAPLPYDTATGDYYKKLTEIPMHGMAPKTDTGKTKAPPMPDMGHFDMVVAQSLWDATMAYSIYQYRREYKKNKKIKIMQVNGRFHSDERFAAVAQLQAHSPKTKSLVISAESGDSTFPVINWDAYKKFGDYIIVTDPNVPKTYDNPPPKVTPEIKAESTLKVKEVKHKNVKLRRGKKAYKSKKPHKMTGKKYKNNN